MSSKKKVTAPEPRKPLSDRFAGWAARWILRYYLLILVAAGVVTVAAYELAVKLKLDTNIVALMPEGVASVENLNRVMEKTGSFSNAMVVVDSPDPDAALNFIKDLREKVLEFPWVGSAEYSEDTSIFEQHKLLYMDTADLREIQRRIDDRIDYEERNAKVDVDGTQVQIKIRQGKKYNAPPSLEFDDIESKYQKSRGKRDKTRKGERLFRSDDGHVTILLVWPRGETTDIGYNRKLLKDLDQAVKEVNPAKYHSYMTVELGGRIRDRVVQFDAAMKDLTSSAGWSISAILLLLAFYYRRVFSVFYIGIPLVVGIIWTFGITQLVLGNLNLITVFLVVVLFGLGIDFGIHNLQRYDEVRRCGGSVEDSLKLIFRRTGVASLLAALTTIGAFYALLITDFRAFFEFGFIAGTGVALIYLSMYLVFPALMLVAERVRLYRSGVPQVDVCNITREGFPRPRMVLGAMLALTAVALLLSDRIGYEDNFSKLKANLPALQSVRAKIDKVFSLSNDRAVVFVPTLEEAKAVVDHIQNKIETDVESPTIEQVRSIYTVVPSKDEQDERLAIIREIRDKTGDVKKFMDPKQRAKLADILDYLDIDRLSANDLPSALRRVYTGLPGSGGYLLYIYNSVSMNDSAMAKAFADDIRELNVNGKTYHPATEALIFVDMRDLMRHDASVAVVSVTVLMCLVLLIAFRSITKALIILFPLAVGVILMTGIMGLFGIKLSIFNMVVLPAVIGIGIDNAIHIYHRYEEEGPRSLRHVIRTTGWAVAITTLTTLFGFGGMLSAANPGLGSLGLLACIGLGTCLLSSLTVLPALLQWLEDRHPHPSPVLVQPTDAQREDLPSAKVA